MAATANELDKFINTHDVLKAKRTISKETVDGFEKSLGFPIGPQLRYCIEKYNCLWFGVIEFIGYDIVDASRSMHEIFPKTDGLIEISSDGELFSTLVDSDDHVFIIHIDGPDGELVSTGMKLFDYLLYVFHKALEDEDWTEVYFFIDQQ